MPWTQARTRPETEQLLAQLVRAAGPLREVGLSLGYHNHDFELARWPDGGRMLDLVLAEPSLFLEPDLGWLWFAGECPRDFLVLHSARCPLLHIKDFRVRGERSFCPVGAGGVGYDTLVPMAARLGAEALIIEQDESPDQDPLEACAQSIRFVRAALTQHAPTEMP
jgi:sugar phosphate isomerase/epimerase